MRSPLSTHWQALAVLISCAGVLQAQLLPSSVCNTCRALFVAEGCVNTPNNLCYLLAFKLTFRFDGEPLCLSYPCINYGNGSSGRSCRGLLGCSSANRLPEGICQLGRVCCNVPADEDAAVIQPLASNSTFGNQVVSDAELAAVKQMLDNEMAMH